MNGMIVGKSQLALHVVQPNRFVGTSSLETVGLAAMLKKYRLKTSAEWLLDKSRMRLLESEYQLTSGEEKSSGKLLFSWSPASVQLTDNLGTKILVIPADTISRNALPFALAHNLKKGKDSIEYAFVDGRKANRVRHMSFTKTGEELLKTKIGDIQTVVLKRSDEVPASYYWYAPELNYVVVKMQYPDELFNSDIITEITRYQSIPQETLSQSKPSAK
ncbi:MAG TPA: hypothetical protein DCZ03_00570 [Gammaproteobacteria bacterium]|nr:hypothetical protein [Gammaproteobacteria bacterium]